MPKKEQPEFTVSDRRKFTQEGELRDDAAATEDAATPAEIPQTGRVDFQREEPPPPAPTSQEQEAQHEAYQKSNQRIDQMLGEQPGNTHSAADFEMTFERLIASLYMSAMLQMGLMAPDGEQPRVDIMGARQTVDTLAILRDKTKGNLSDAEEKALTNILFE